MSVNEIMHTIVAEGIANDELRRTDPEAYQAKMEATMPVNTCCFCNESFRGYGHNPQPLLDEGRACDVCNCRIVIKSRFQSTRESDPY